MKNWKVKFSNSTVEFVLDGKFANIAKMVDKANAIYITDENVYALHQQIFKGKPTIVIPAGEIHKQQATVDFIIEALLNFGANRQSVLIGVGGGVVTDMVGYVAGVFMRGVQFGFVPTTLLAMVDAAIGGKNGIDVGVYKNMVGLIRQPAFIVYDHSFLTTLPSYQWENGFAEIIKHACIKDADLFDQLEQHSLNDFKADLNFMSAIINRNVIIKSEIVIKDELDKSDRKLLNFGHTFGHAVENIYQHPHGFAVSIGMVVACKLSEQLTGLSAFKTNRIVELLSRYGLPVHHKIDHDVVFDMIKKDKKRNGENIDFVLLNDIGDAHAKPVSLSFIKENLPYLIS